MLKSLRVFFFIAYVLLCCEACGADGFHVGQAKTDRIPVVASTIDEGIRNWRAPEIFGMQLGRSTLDQLKARFGKPGWEGSNQEKVFVDESEDELLVQYFDVPEFDPDFGRMSADFIVGKKTKLIKAVTLYIEKDLSKKDVILKYGNDYFETDSGYQCLDASRRPGPSKQTFQGPYGILFSTKGIYVSVRDDGGVDSIQFASRCIQATATSN